MLAVTFDNLLFFLLIAVAALFQLLSKAATKSGKSQSDKTSKPPVPPEPPQARRARPESDADRIRKFLEALGQPPTSSPPPPVARRIDLPPRPLAPVQPPPVVLPRAWGLPRKQRAKRDVVEREISPPEPARPVDRGRAVAPLPAAPAFEVQEGASPIEFEQPAVVKTRGGADTGADRLTAKEAAFKTDITTLLRSKPGLRHAIILREIFGVPRSLQPLDAVGDI